MEHQIKSIFHSFENTIIIAVTVIFLFSATALNCNDNKKITSKKTDKIMNDTASLVREGVIDLNSIDANKDNMVYQDQMHWNVLSDNSAKCPLCKMTLKGVSLTTAKDSLVTHGFKVKEVIIK